MIFVFNCILSGCTVAVFIPKYKIMARGEAEWKRGIWNGCFHPDKSSTDSLQCVWRSKMRVHISFFSLSFKMRRFQWCAQRDGVVKPSCLRGWGSERAAAEMFKTHQNVHITHVKQSFLLKWYLLILTSRKETFLTISHVSSSSNDENRPVAWCSLV